MSPFANFSLALVYFLIAIAIAVREYNTIQRKGSDSFTVILAFVFIYLLAPSIGIHVVFGLYGKDLRTGNYLFDKIYENLNVVDASAVCLLTILFVGGLYLSAGIHRLRPHHVPLKKAEFQPRDGVIFFGISILTFICVKFFIDLGESFIERYVNLILFRNLDASIERTFFSANAFSLTQTLTWLAAIFFFIYFSKGHKIKAAVFFVVILIAAFLMGSRRGFIFPILIIYFCFLLSTNKLHLRKILLLTPLLLLWIGIGKELTASIAYNVDSEKILTTYESSGSFVLRALSDQGISQVQSFGVFQYFEVSPRLGIDHLLSLIRRFPDGMLGLNIDWPERIVRTTTEVFASKNDADIPPGLIGQSWLDFPILGALFFGLFIGAQCHFLDRWMNRARNSPAKSAITTLAAMVIALPINTGSYDFTFSVDMIFLILLLLLFFRLNKFAPHLPPREINL